MAYTGESFGPIVVEVEKDGPDKVRINGDSLTFEQASALTSFVSDQIFKIRKDRGEFDRTW